MNKKVWYILGAALGVIAGIAAVLAITLVAMGEPKKATSGTNNGNSTNAPQNSTTLTGEIVCLTKADTTQPQTLECAYGIKTAEGKQYSVKDTEQAGDFAQLPAYAVGTKVVITGSVEAPSADQHYDIVGVIAATNITKVE